MYLQFFSHVSSNGHEPLTAGVSNLKLLDSNGCRNKQGIPTFLEAPAAQQAPALLDTFIVLHFIPCISEQVAGGFSSCYINLMCNFFCALVACTKADAYHSCHAFREEVCTGSFLSDNFHWHR